MIIVNSEPSWTPWASWSECTVSCGGGVRELRRECLNGSKCVGADTRLELCNEDECPGKQLLVIILVEL